MRGVVITLDAILAISFFMFVMILIAGQTYQPRSPGSIYLKQFTLDTMTVLEKTGRVDSALNGNTSSLEDLLAATPDLACIRIYLINGSYDAVVSAVRPDCNESGGSDLQIATRPVLYHGSNYIMRAESWFRKEAG